MDNQQANRIVKAIIIAGIFIVVLIIALALLLAVSFDRAARSIHETNQRIDQLKVQEKSSFEAPIIDYERIALEINTRVSAAVAAIPKPKDGQNGKDAIAPEPVPGKDGKDGQNGATPPCYYEPAQCQGARGIAGISPRQIEFDGNGHWRFAGDDEWLPLFRVLTGTDE